MKGLILQDVSVRGAAVQAITKLFGHSDLVGGLRQFAERTKARVIEMALREVDMAVRKEVIQGVLHAYNR